MILGCTKCNSLNQVKVELDIKYSDIIPSSQKVLYIIVDWFHYQFRHFLMVLFSTMLFKALHEGVDDHFVAEGTLLQSRKTYFFSLLGAYCVIKPLQNVNAISLHCACFYLQATVPSIQ